RLAALVQLDAKRRRQLLLYRLLHRGADVLVDQNSERTLLFMRRPQLLDSLALGVFLRSSPCRATGWWFPNRKNAPFSFSTSPGTRPACRLRVSTPHAAGSRASLPGTTPSTATAGSATSHRTSATLAARPRSSPGATKSTNSLASSTPGAGPGPPGTGRLLAPWSSTPNRSSPCLHDHHRRHLS